jgi:hypothetical protein
VDDGARRNHRRLERPSPAAHSASFRGSLAPRSHGYRGPVTQRAYSEIDNSAEGATSQPPISQLDDEAFDYIEPGRSRCEREMETWRPCEPRTDFRVLVGGVVVHNYMQAQFRRSLAVDPVGEPDELLMPVAAHALTDHLPIQHVERPPG